MKLMMAAAPRCPACLSHCPIALGPSSGEEDVPARQSRRRLAFHVPQAAVSSADPGDSGDMEERGGLSAWRPAALCTRPYPAFELPGYQQDTAWIFPSPGFPKHKMEPFVWTAL